MWSLPDERQRIPFWYCTAVSRNRAYGRKSRAAGSAAGATQQIAASDLPCAKQTGKEFLEQIERNDTNWFSNENIEVILKIDNSAKEYFLRKEILPNKKLIKQNDECFTISTIVSYDDEILRVVKSWLPYIKIVSPQYLQEKLNNILKSYMNHDE